MVSALDGARGLEFGKWGFEFEFRIWGMGCVGLKFEVWGLGFEGSGFGV